MSEAIWTKRPATEVRVGDRVRVSDIELTVARIDTNFFGRDDMLAFVEDSDVQWIKVPSLIHDEVEVTQV